MIRNTKSFVRLALSDAIARARARWGPDRRVLLYHRVEPRPRAGDPYVVSPTALDRHLVTARQLGYDIVGVDRVLAWSGRTRGRELLVAFDDGYRSVLEHALPTLIRHSARSLCLLVPAAMSRTSEWERPLGLEPSPIMSWDDAAELARLGFDLGSHGLDHRDLTGLTEDELAEQARVSRMQIEQRLGLEVRAFSVPFGRDDGRMDRHLSAAGYRVKITHQLARPSSRHGLLTLPCTAVEQGDSHREFIRKLTGAYDWLGAYHWLRGRYPHRPGRNGIGNTTNEVS